MPEPGVFTGLDLFTGRTVGIEITKLHRLPEHSEIVVTVDRLTRFRCVCLTDRLYLQSERGSHLE